MKLIFVVTEDWYFVTHRLSIARAARTAGYHVAIASRFDAHEAELRAAGFELLPLTLRRRGNSLWQELASILELRAIYKRQRPVIVHQVALKPVVFGSMAAWGLQGVGVVNALAGLGHVFTARGIIAAVSRFALGRVLRVVLSRPGSVTIVQNDADRESLLRARLVPESSVRMIRGAGVELSDFVATSESPGAPVVLFAGRFLRSKGIDDFVCAARTLRAAGVVARFVIAGEPDADNPTSVTRRDLENWEREGVVENWGRRSDMPRVLSAAHIVCLPSRYGEGVPKILLEAAAAGRPIVTTDWPGCRDTLRAGESGLLVPPGDSHALAAALRELIEDGERRRRFGAAGRALAEREFDVREVAAKTLDCYRSANPAFS